MYLTLAEYAAEAFYLFHAGRSPYFFWLGADAEEI